MAKYENTYWYVLVCICMYFICIDMYWWPGQPYGVQVRHDRDPLGLLSWPGSCGLVARHCSHRDKDALLARGWASGVDCACHQYSGPPAAGTCWWHWNHSVFDGKPETAVLPGRHLQPSRSPRIRQHGYGLAGRAMVWPSDHPVLAEWCVEIKRCCYYVQVLLSSIDVVLSVRIIHFKNRYGQIHIIQINTHKYVHTQYTQKHANTKYTPIHATTYRYRQYRSIHMIQTIYVSIHTQYIHNFCVCIVFVLGSMFVLVRIRLYNTNEYGTNTDIIHANTCQYMQYMQYNGAIFCERSDPVIHANTSQYKQNTSQYKHNTYIIQGRNEHRKWPRRECITFVFACIGLYWTLGYILILTNTSWMY